MTVTPGQERPQTPTPAPQSSSATKVASGKVVKYVGTADVREIDKAGWENAGVTDQNKVVWNKKNRWTVPVEDLSDAAVAYCDDQDSGFAVVDADADVKK